MVFPFIFSVFQTSVLSVSPWSLFVSVLKIYTSTSVHTGSAFSFFFVVVKQVVSHGPAVIFCQSKVM